MAITSPSVPAEQTLCAPVVQTTFFQRVEVDPGQRSHGFFNPIQAGLVEGFPATFDLVVLSSVHGAPRGTVGCTHLITLDGEEVGRYEHPPAAVAHDGAGVAFHLTLKQVTALKPGVLTVRTTLTDDSASTTVPLRLMAKEGLRGGLNLQG